MRHILIVCAHFPPVNGADMHRIRTSLRHYERCGWEPRVLTVAPASMELNWNDPLLLETIPASVPVRRVKALPVRFTRPFGLGAVGLRAWWAMARAGDAWIREAQPDLVFFSTTAFPLMTLGPRWLRKFGVPYVVDLQDPWIQEDAPRPGLKHRLMRALHARLEPAAMRGAGGMMAVAPGYLQAVHRRHPVTVGRPEAVIRFGAAPEDWSVAESSAPSHGFFETGDGLLHGVCVGALAPAMLGSVRLLLNALRRGLDEAPEVFDRVRLHFIGTSYAGAGAQPATAALVAELGLEGRVMESSARIPYFTALRLQREAAFLFIPGSAEGDYVPSRLTGCLLARRPVLAVCHEAGGAAAVLAATGGAECVTFRPGKAEEAGHRLLPVFRRLLENPESSPALDEAALAPHLAAALTGEQCRLFDQVLQSQS